MPRKHKPRWDYQGRHLFSQDGLEIYSESEIDSLCQKFEISDDKLKETKEFLEGAANIYRIHKNNKDDFPKSGEVRAALQHIQSLATGLHSCIDRMDDLTAKLFWRCDGEVEQAAGFGVYDGDRPTDAPYGQKFDYINTDDGTVIVYADGPMIIRSILAISNYSSAAISQLKPDRGGRRRLEGLRMWTANMRIFWQDILGRTDFTVDEHGGEPITLASQFCIEAFRPVDSEIATKTILNAMRKQITQHRQQFTQKNHTPK